MNYSDDDKALIMLSFETSYQKKRDAADGVDSPKELYRNYAHADVVIEEMNKKGIVAPRSKISTTRRRRFTARETSPFWATTSKG